MQEKLIIQVVEIVWGLWARHGPMIVPAADCAEVLTQQMQHQLLLLPHAALCLSEAGASELSAVPASVGHGIQGCQVQSIQSQGSRGLAHMVHTSIAAASAASFCVL